MLALIVAAWLAAPMFPINPIEQDTLASTNMHLTVGLTGPNKVSRPGVEFTGKYELLLRHPWVLRGSAEYSFSQIDDRNMSDGNIHAAALAIEGLYYRGTDKLTGYFGVGVLLHRGFISLESSVADSLFVNEQITDVDMQIGIGGRLLMGLRFDKLISLELAVSEIRPNIVRTSRVSANQFKESTERVKLHDVRMTVGFVLPLSN